MVPIKPLLAGDLDPDGLYVEARVCIPAPQLRVSGLGLEFRVRV